ncbi:uncharacterized protein [Henckelia pumila]|uniref:uncharacterized protein n=1 Tax=Henckelia pumila TaxID=405737 RepID=UPI003C6E3BB8
MSAGILGASAPEHPSPVILRFFKILLNEEYSQILYLPPAFARKVEYLVDRETYLENSGGKRWAVKISKVDGSLAFQKGWNEFFTQQPLIVGHFLEFHYIKGSHFLVRVYGRSGCERRINLNRGLKTAKNFDKVTTGDEPIQKFDEVRNSKLKNRFGNGKRPKDSSEKDAARKDEKSSSILMKKNESQVIQKAGAEKSCVVPTITPDEVLVDVPISYAENCHRGDLSNVGTSKAFENLGDEMPKVVSGFQRGEGSKSLLQVAAQNAQMRTKGDTRTFP